MHQLLILCNQIMQYILIQIPLFLVPLSFAAQKFSFSSASKEKDGKKGFRKEHAFMFSEGRN